MNTLVYVDKKLIVPIGVKLVGSSVSSNETSSAKSGFNWVVEASLRFSSETGVETRVCELFPEDIFHAVYDKIEHKRLSIPSLCQAIQGEKLRSADVVSVLGTLRIPGVDLKPYNPFDPPPIVIEKSYTVYGEQCFIGQIEADGFVHPVFFLIDSKEIVCYCNHKPVEVVGVLKWSPTFEVAGFATNQTMLCAALLLRR